jgi:hypothetical protein
LLPVDRFPCGDQGLLCEYGKQYCQVIVGGQPNPQTGEAILSYSCVNESTCSVLDEACACLESQVQPGGASCDDNGLLPPIVTFFAP